MRNNWITIYDNTAEARLGYVSESVTDHTGWEPEELIGVVAYTLFHTVDLESLRKVHTANVSDEKMSSLVSYRFWCKNGDYVHLETIVHCCHDVIVSCNFIYDENSHDHKLRANTVDEIFVCLPDGSLQLAGAWNDRQDKVEDMLSPDKVWVNSKLAKQQERRFCLILNRYTHQLNIVYASQLAEELVSLRMPQSMGHSLFEYISEQDMISIE